MPNIDEVGKAWQKEVAERIGLAIARVRDARGFSAVDLADRTKRLGYPVTRVAISKIENNLREGKLDLAELTIIAAALGVSPVQLIYPELPHGLVHVLPSHEMASLAAMKWFSGEHWLPRTSESLAPDLLEEDFQVWRERAAPVFLARSYDAALQRGHNWNERASAAESDGDVKKAQEYREVAEAAAELRDGIVRDMFARGMYLQARIAERLQAEAATTLDENSHDQ